MSGKTSEIGFSLRAISSLNYYDTLITFFLNATFLAVHVLNCTSHVGSCRINFLALNATLHFQSTKRTEIEQFDRCRSRDDTKEIRK